MSEPELLQEVKPEDRMMVKDVIAVMRCLGKCESWSVTPVRGVYEVLGWVAAAKQDLEVEHEDLELVQAVNQLRVRASVRAFATGKTAIVARVLPHSEPAMIQETTLKRVRKRRWLERAAL